MRGLQGIGLPVSETDVPQNRNTEKKNVLPEELRQKQSLTGEVPPRGAHAGELDHPRREHEPEEQPPHQPHGDDVVGPVGQRGEEAALDGALQEPEGGHQDGQETNLQQEGVPGTRNNYV